MRRSSPPIEGLKRARHLSDRPKSEGCKTRFLCTLSGAPTTPTPSPRVPAAETATIEFPLRHNTFSLSPAALCHPPAGARGWLAPPPRRPLRRPFARRPVPVARPCPPSLAPPAPLPPSLPALGGLAPSAVAPSAGLEPALTAPEADALSAELRGRATGGVGWWGQPTTAHAVGQL